MAITTTNVLVSGAGRGLGKVFVERFLTRPNHVVVATVRDVNSPNAKALLALPAAEGSKLVVVKIESASTTDPFDAAKELEAQGIDRLDIIIANAAIVGDQGPIEAIDPETVVEVYAVSGAGPALLFMGMRPLLQRSQAPKWMSMSSAVASIEDYEKYKFFKMFPYAAAKAALNHFTKTIHVDYSNIVSFAVSPGFLGTDMGENALKAYGITSDAFDDLDTNITRLFGLLDNATRDNYSGKFVNVDGTIIPW